MLRAYAMSIGMDPDIAEKVAQEEGLADDTWQSNLQQPYGREQSYGDFQLHYDPTGKRPGLGNEFVKMTGLDVSDPANWFDMNKFALDKANKGGWGPWMGAAKAGITGFMGIGGQPQMVAYNTDDTPAMGAAMGGFATGPGDVQARMDTGAVAGLLDEDPSFDVAGFAKLGGKIMERAKKNSTPERQEFLQPQVLQPLKRYTLKGSM
tara:strand:+ start:5021 stop:5641 length:621 start_codon:yes stop_codon:yes gene_type:complete